MPNPALTILNTYELTAPAPDFEAAIAALADRVAREGHPGVLSYRFFVNADEATARAVIDYDTPEAWIGHHEIAMPWPEMQAMHNVAHLAEVTFLGPLTPEIRAWLDASPLTAQIRSGNRFAAGFRR